MPKGADSNPEVPTSSGVPKFPDPVGASEHSQSQTNVWRVAGKMGKANVHTSTSSPTPVLNIPLASSSAAGQASSVDERSK